MSSQHAVHKLFQYRQSISTKPYASRGKNQIRCDLCLLAQQYCTCDVRQTVESNHAFLLLMYDDEVLKPSNSGRLIADLIPDTHAFLWSRTEPNEAMLRVINDAKYQPLLIFPSEYALEGQAVVDEISPSILSQGKTPLFILLDGSWREAKKMFRKSPYLHQLPMLSFNPQSAAKYGLRKGSRDFQLGTAEVAALVLELAGEVNNSISLNAWFELFIESSRYGRNYCRVDMLRPLANLKRDFIETLVR